MEEEIQKTPQESPLNQDMKQKQTQKIVQFAFAGVVFALAISLVGVTFQTYRYSAMKKKYNDERLVSYGLLQQSKQYEQRVQELEQALLEGCPVTIGTQE